MQQIKTSTSANQTQNWLLIIAITLIWGSSYILMKRGLEVFSPPQVAALRLLLTSLFVVPIFFRYLPTVPRAKLPYLALIAFVGNGMPPFLFTLAQQHIHNSSVVGILYSTTPLFTLLVGVLAFGVHFSWRRLLGILIGLCGAIFLIWQNSHHSDANNQYEYGILVIIATFFYSLSANIVKKHGQQIHPIAINVTAFSILAIPSAVVLFSTDFLLRVQTNPQSWRALGFLLILAVLGTAVANMLFYRLTQRTDAVFASITTYLMPLVAIAWGFADGESITWTYWLSMAIILLGVYLTQRQ